MNGESIFVLLAVANVWQSARAIPQLNASQVALIVSNMENDNNLLMTDNNQFPKFVRLIFHDCVGGCDGCLNVTADFAPNAGLANTRQLLENFRVNHALESIISRADLWALASLVALKQAKNHCRARIDGECPTFTFPAFRDGRLDCATSPDEDEVHGFPDAKKADATTWFASHGFGFTAAEVVALLGAHTLGGAKVSNSGYKGKWVKRWRVLENSFYKDLIGKKFNHTNVAVRNNEARWQWNRPFIDNNNNTQHRFMLNQDMGLYRNLNLTALGEEQNAVCKADSRQCDEEHGFASTAQQTQIEAYANETVGTAAWYADFSPIFEKMIEFGSTLTNDPLPIPDP